MSDDLKQRLRQYLNRPDSRYEVTVCYNGLRDEAADRIEQLEARNKELTLQLLATSGQAADALDKLAKAVEALRSVEDEYNDIQWGPELQSIKQVRAVLAELEGGEEAAVTAWRGRE